MDEVSQPAPRRVTGGLGCVAVVTAATLAVAVPYWAADPSAVSDDGLAGSALLVAAVAFAGACAIRAAGWLGAWLAALLMCVPAVIAVLGRVVLDTAADPTSHNLWPFEVAVAVVMSVVPALAGAVVGWAIASVGARAPRG